VAAASSAPVATPPAPPDPPGGPLLDGDALRQLERLGLVQLDAVVSGFAGTHTGPRGASGIEFADYRRYTPGDDLRRIDWSVYARLREAFVRTAPGEARTGIALLVDVSASMDWAGDGDPPLPTKLLHAQRVAAMLAAVALLRADTARLAALSDGAARSGPDVSGPALVGQVLDAMRAQEPGRTTGLAAAVRAQRLADRPADLAVLLTDALVDDADLDGALQELAASARRATLVHVWAPRERRPAVTGAVELVDAETGERRVVDVSEEEAARQAARFDARAAELRERCRVRGVTYVPAPTDVPALEVLFGAARQAGLVGD